MQFKTRRRIRPLEAEARKQVKRRLHSMVGSSGIWPLDAPGMPPPGPDFLAEATARQDGTVYQKSKAETVFVPGDILRELYGRALRQPGFSLNVSSRAGHRSEAVFIPGHVWGQYSQEWANSVSDPLAKDPKPVDGPHPCEVMVLGKMPWREELQHFRNMVGATGEVLTENIKRLRIKGAEHWYIANLVKFMPPDDSTTLKAAWIKDCLPLLHMELRIVRPKYILCLGADASKALLGNKFNVSYMEGRVVEYSYPVHLSHEDKPEVHTALVMTVLHPAEVARSPDKGRILERGLGRFQLLISGARFDLEERGLDHRVIDTLEDAEDWVDEVNAEFASRKRKERLVAWDAEWQGQHPINPGSYLRTVQASWGPRKAVCFKLRHAGGKTSFRDRDGKPAIKRLMRLLQEFCTDKRAVGHFFVSDLEWLIHEGFNPIRDCPVPLHDRNGKLAWQRLRDGEGWLDTAMMAHAIEETAQLGLESLLVRYTTCPRYDITLEDWKKDECKRLGIDAGALEGFGDCPDKILCPYGNYDADGTGRLATPLSDLLTYDYEGNCCWESCWESMIVQRVILKIHQNGVSVDRKRIDQFTKAFMAARYSQEEKIRHWSRWPDFNVRSPQQVREFLFGEHLNRKVSQDGHDVRIRPHGAKALYVEPLLDTSKPPRRWDDLTQRGLDKEATPGTGKMILGILAEENMNVSEQISWVRDYRFLDQVLKSVLRPPREAEDGSYVENDEGFLEYDAGLAASIDVDGRVRTHLLPTAETGRWKSRRPNLQNFAKQRDPDYERMLGAAYKNKLRSILKASPGYVLIEFDYIGAELLGMAIMAGDETMIDHCLRAQLSESDPNYYDIHSHVAVMAFKLGCKPTKSGLKEIGKSHFRTLAKNVIFGIAYGRGAKAIALQAREQGIRVSVEDAQRVIDTIFDLYPMLQPFYEEAKTRALQDKWLCHCFGRFRRFPTASDYKLEGEFERQAMNFPIQGMVASAVDRGLAYLDEAIEENTKTGDIRLLLQMHDAGLLETRYDLVGYSVELIRWAMSHCVPIYPTNLAGEPTGKGPYYLGVDVSVEEHWGEKISATRCNELGIPLKFAGKM